MEEEAGLRSVGLKTKNRLNVVFTLVLNGDVRSVPFKLRDTRGSKCHVEISRKAFG
jgi:hypothetical protein